jgi:glycosyltransferase involved in cell wall biosynthesis
MEILMVAPQPFLRPRGTPLSVLHRVRALTWLGHNVHLVTYPFGENPAVPGLTIHRAWRPPFVRDVAVGPSLAKLMLDLPLARLATNLAATGRFDLLHTHEEAGWLGAQIRRRYGLRHLYDMHSSLPQQMSNLRRFRSRIVVEAFERLERYTLAHADAIIAICPALREQVLASGYRGPLAMIENTLDFEVPPPTPETIAALRHHLDVGIGPVVVYTGTLEPYQGLDLLLAAVPAVAARIQDVRFVIVGGTNAQICALARQAAEGGVAAVVRFIPAVPPAEVPLYQRLADVLVTTRSSGTNTPLKLYQYLRAERPIVASDIESHTQVLDRRVAELVRPEPGAIAEGIIRVLRDPDHGRSLAWAAARLAAERYSGDQYMRNLKQLLAELTPATDQPSGPRVPEPRNEPAPYPVAAES